MVVITTQLNNCAVFSKLDFKSEFNQLKLDHGLRCLSFMQESNTKVSHGHKTRTKRTVTTARAPLYRHTATSRNTQQFDNCRDI